MRDTCVCCSASLPAWICTWGPAVCLHVYVPSYDLIIFEMDLHVHDARSHDMLLRPNPQQSNFRIRRSRHSRQSFDKHEMLRMKVPKSRQIGREGLSLLSFGTQCRRTFGDVIHIVACVVERHARLFCRALFLRIRLRFGAQRSQLRAK